MSDKETQRVRDPVHGLVVFGGGNDAHQNETDHIAWRLLNTREFQRLRRVRQLGFSDLVYPGATHSRLAHAIGVYHTARQLIEVIRRRQDATDDPEPKDIATVSGVGRSLRDAERIQRVYASDEEQVNTLRKIMQEEIQQ